MKKLPNVFKSALVSHFVNEVKWALGSITMNKASGGEGTSVERF